MFVFILSSLAIPTIFLIFGYVSFTLLIISTIVGFALGQFIAFLTSNFQLTQFLDHNLNYIEKTKASYLAHYQQKNVLLVQIQQAIYDKEQNMPNGHWKDFELARLQQSLQETCHDKYLLWELANSNFSLWQKNFSSCLQLTILILLVSASAILLVRILHWFLNLILIIGRKFVTKNLSKRELKKIFNYE